MSQILGVTSGDPEMDRKVDEEIIKFYLEVIAEGDGPLDPFDAVLKQAGYNPEILDYLHLEGAEKNQLGKDAISIIAKLFVNTKLISTLIHNYNKSIFEWDRLNSLNYKDMLEGFIEDLFTKWNIKLLEEMVFVVKDEALITLLNYYFSLPESIKFRETLLKRYSFPGDSIPTELKEIIDLFDDIKRRISEGIFEHNLMLIQDFITEGRLNLDVNNPEKSLKFGMSTRQAIVILAAERINTFEVISDKKTLDWWADVMFSLLSRQVIINRLETNDIPSFTSVLKQFFTLDSLSGLSEFERRNMEIINSNPETSSEFKDARLRIKHFRTYRKMLGFNDAEIIVEEA